MRDDHDIPLLENEQPRYEILSDGEITERKAVKLSEEPAAAPDDGEGWRRMPVVINWQEKSRLVLEANRRMTKARFKIARPPVDVVESFNMGILREMLEKSRVIYGVRQEVITEMFSNFPYSLPYEEPVIIAVGVEPKNGIDGICNELFERETKPTPKERADGSVDFKNLQIIKNIQKGTVICEITAPIQGVPGTSISGVSIRPVPAKTPFIPRGENVDLVEVDEKHSQLVAAVEGNLMYRNQRFCVEELFTVGGNLDISIGNIDFSGNVVVKGDVFEGFSIKAGKSVTVYGIVEGAKITAGGDITLHRGINGMSKGVLESKGSISARFLENCTVRAAGDVKAEEIINCTVETDGGITLEGRGRLAGGHVTAFGSVSAKVIGSRANTPIDITLGLTPNMVNRRNKLQEQYTQTLAEQESLTRDVIFLEQPKYNNSFEHQKLLEDYRGKLNLASFKKKRLESKLRQIKAEQDVAIKSTLSANSIDPPFRLTIGRETLVLYDSASMCRFYLSEEGEIVMGTK